jgi:hypothetical protein
MRALDLQFDQLVIGADLSALLFAYVNKIPVIYSKRKPPYEYPREDGFQNKTELWDFCIFNLALHGYMPVGDKVHSIRVEDEHVKITTKNNFLINIKYNKLWIGNDEGVEGLPLISGKTNNDNHVLDIFFIDYKVVLEPVINYEDNFVKQIIYNPFSTYDKTKKSLLVYSIISDEDIKKYEYSETYVRLKLLRNMNRKIMEASHQKRTIIPIGKNIYEETDKIKNLLATPEEILNMEGKEDDYMSFIQKILWNK